MNSYMLVRAINAAIGLRIQKRRIYVGLPRKELARQIGMSQQQFYKYEMGANRISAALLLIIAETLDVPVHYFYDRKDLLLIEELSWQDDPHDPFE